MKICGDSCLKNICNESTSNAIIGVNKLFTFHSSLFTIYRYSRDYTSSNPARFFQRSP